MSHSPTNNNAGHRSYRTPRRLMAVLSIMRAHKAFQYIHFIAVAIACASVMFRRPAQKRYLFRSSVQRHQVGINTVIDYPKPIT
jgi:hypothetical protein